MNELTRAELIKEYNDQCNGKCFKCDLGGFFINSEGKYIKLPYSYSYKVGCDDDRYINVEEVLSMINMARQDAIDEFDKRLDLRIKIGNTVMLMADSKFYEAERKNIYNHALEDILNGIKEILEDNAIYNIDCIDTLVKQLYR